RLGLVGAAGDVGVAPALAAERHEPLALVGRDPGGTVGRVESGRPGQVLAQAQQDRVPADADRARAELGPHVIADVRDVLDLQPGPDRRPAVFERRQADLDPAHLAAELPGDEEAVRRVAALDRAARVALELVAAAELELARDRQEPPGDALGAGAGVPDVLDGGVVGLADDDGARLARLHGPRADPALDGVDLVDDIDHGATFPSPCRGGA